MRDITPYPTREKSFKAGGTITPGSLVKLSAANTVIVNDASDGEHIGYARYDNRLAAANSGESDYSSGDMVSVFLRDETVKVIAGGAIAVGNFVKAAASGKVVVEATAGTRTLNTIGIALEAASADGDEIIIVPA